jgi:hypothetical protein
MAMRITPYSQTKFLPFRLMYGREVIVPAKLSFNYKEQFINYDHYDQHVNDLSSKLFEVFERAHSNNLKSKGKMINTRLKKKGVSISDFKMGNLVLFD